MSDYFPSEVWIDIFTRLPVKTLLQIRSVCKIFHSLISDPSFISFQFKKTKHANSLLLRHFNQKENTEHYLVFDDIDNQSPGLFHEPNVKKIDFPFKSRWDYHFRIVGSCNGVICLSDDYGSYASGIILWNPSIKRFVSLPKPRVTKRTHGSYMSILGFGFDEKSCDFKVVRVAYVKGRNGKDLIPPEVELYKLSSKSWTSFNSGAPPYGIFAYTWSQAFVSGAVHWVGYDPCVTIGNEECALIVAFDVYAEVFREVKLPDCLQQCGWDLCVTVLGEKLAVLQLESRPRNTCYSVWVMEEYGVVESWIKRYSINVNPGLQKLIGFMRNGEVLGVTVRGKLVSCDPNSSRMKTLGICGAIDAFHMDSYMESLVLLGAETALLGTEAITCGYGEEEREDSELLGINNRFVEFKHGEERGNNLFGPIPESELSKYLCGFYEGPGVSKMQCEELLKELLPDATDTIWEEEGKDW